MFCAAALPLWAGCDGSKDKSWLISEAQDLQAPELREDIAQQVGGLENLMVPGDDAAIPLPADDAARPERYQTTEAKRYFGKLMFHDPVRTARINVNTSVPFDLPAGPAFGGTIEDSNVEAIVAAQPQTGSCGSCHLGEAGAIFNFNVGGKGRGYTDEDGSFIPRRRVQSSLPTLRDAAVFPGDPRVDALPTLTDGRRRRRSARDHDASALDAAADRRRGRHTRRS